MRILFIGTSMLEWKWAKPYSYNWGLGITRGLEEVASHVDKLLVYCYDVALDMVEEYARVYSSEKFDLIWFDVTYSGIWRQSPKFCDWLVNAAPVRIGMISESMTMGDVKADWLLTREADIKENLKYCTHAVCVDERDVPLINTDTRAKAHLLIPTIPKEYIKETTAKKHRLPAAFFGTPYPPRNTILSMPELQGLVTIAPQLDNANDVQNYIMANILLTRMFQQHPAAVKGIPELIDSSHAIIFKNWIENIRGFGCAILNLPSFVMAYPGRVYEAMAAGVPVITPPIDYDKRPTLQRLFSDGVDIVFYDKNKPEQIKDCIIKCQDADFNEMISANALDKIRGELTTEDYIPKLVKWALEE